VHVEKLIMKMTPVAVVLHECMQVFVTNPW